jgi:metal-sulfur cluster biosynthetic enzyme
MTATQTISEDDVRNQLREIVDPCSESRGIGNNIIDMGLLDSIEIENNEVTVYMRLTSPACHMVSYFDREVETQVETIDGVKSATLETDSGLNWDKNEMTPEGRRRREEYISELRQPAGED